MSWVTKRWGPQKDKAYNTRRSAFWRVIRAVVYRLKIADADDNETPWSSHLVWSNLYKIAPCDGGNPNSTLRKAQLDGCVKLLQWELKHYQPRRVLFLTGWWADQFPFLNEAWKDQPKPKVQSSVEDVGQLDCGSHKAICVVAGHPQGKNETNWVNEGVNALGRAPASENLFSGLNVHSLVQQGDRENGSTLVHFTAPAGNGPTQGVITAGTIQPGGRSI